MSDINKKHEFYNMYFEVLLWVCGLVCISFLVSGLIVNNVKFMILGGIFIWGVPSIIKLTLAYNTKIRYLTILILCINIAVNIIAEKIEMRLIFISITFSLIWAAICFYKFIPEYKKE